MKKETRVINIPKEDFDKIKKYCDDNALQMSKWMTKIALERIEKKSDYVRTTFVVNDTGFDGKELENEIKKGNIEVNIKDDDKMFPIITYSKKEK